MVNATRTPHEYKFTKAATYAEAIEYDAKKAKGRVVSCDSNNSSFSKNDSWINSRYFGFINSRLYIGTDGNNTTKQDFDLKWEKGSWCDSKVKGSFRNLKVNKQGVNIFTISSHANLYLSKYMRKNNLGKYKKSAIW